MAITRQTSNSGGAGYGTSLALTKPTGLADNDLLVASVNVRLANLTINAPAGWTKAGEAKHGTATTTVALFYRYVATASGEGASYTFSWTGGAANSGVIVRYDGQDTGTPEDVAASSNTSGAAGTTGTWTGITTATANAMLVAVMSATNGTTTYSAESAPLTEVADLGVNQSGVFCDGIQASAGATGSLTATLNSSRDWSAVLWAIRPATGGGGGPAATPRLTLLGVG